MSLIDNFHNLKKSIPSHIKLIVVSKNRPISAIEELYNAGQRDFGENKIQELLEKDQQTLHLKDLRWHMIGHIQINKLKRLLSLQRLCAIHSVDREDLVQALGNYQGDLSQTHGIGLFWELNLSLDQTKYGFINQEQVRQGLLYFEKSPKIFNQGLMCMGPSVDDEHLTKTRKVFKEMNTIKNEWSQELGDLFPQGIKLSMGMSNDYKLAIEFNSDYLRVGSKLFTE